MVYGSDILLSDEPILYNVLKGLEDVENLYAETNLNSLPLLASWKILYNLVLKHVKLSTKRKKLEYNNKSAKYDEIIKTTNTIVICTWFFAKL